MGHIALLDDNNIVVKVLTSKDKNENGIDWEAYYSALTGYRALHCSYNTSGGVHNFGGVPFRGNFPSIGDVYIEQLDVFTTQKPYDSWELSPVTFLYEPPVAIPNGEKRYLWDESTLSWVEVQ